jgi:hypothetical protein
LIILWANLSCFEAGVQWTVTSIIWCLLNSNVWKASQMIWMKGTRKCFARLKKRKTHSFKISIYVMPNLERKKLPVCLFEGPILKVPYLFTYVSWKLQVKDRHSIWLQNARLMVTWLFMYPLHNYIGISKMAIVQGRILKDLLHKAKNVIWRNM